MTARPQTKPATPVKVGGQALADGVLMRTDRAWAIARADGSVEAGATAPNRAERIPVLRVLVGLGSALTLAIGRGILGRGADRPGRRASRRLNRRFLWVLFGIEAATLVAGLWLPSGPVTLLGRLLMAAVPFCMTLAVLRMATPQSLWRYHGAEHKAVAAHEAGTDLHDLRAVLAAPRVHDRCGTNLVVLMLVFGVALTRLPTLVQVPAFLLLLASAAEVVAIAARRPRALWSRLVLGGGRAVQRYVTTCEPTADEQAVGCHALRACLVEHARAIGGDQTTPTLATAA